MILLTTLLLAAALAPQKPPVAGADLARDCSAYLSLALGETEAAGRLDEPLQRAFELWFAEHARRLGPGNDEAGRLMAVRSNTLERDSGKVRAARTAWCRLNSPAETAA